MSLKHKISEGLYAYSGLLLKKKPTVIYAPGRVGSMGLLKNLRDAGVYSFKLESATIEQRGSAQFVSKNFIIPKKPSDLITIVRDPIEMMVSYFYSKAYYDHIPESRAALNAQDVPKLQQLFIEHVLQTNRLDSHLYWFEKEFIPYTGIDIFNHAFDTEKKYTVVPDKTFPTLILRLDLPDTEKAEQIKSFLSIKNFTITRSNVRSEKVGGDSYTDFKSTLSVLPELIEKIYTSKYANHFFSQEEIGLAKARWS